MLFENTLTTIREDNEIRISEDQVQKFRMHSFKCTNFVYYAIMRCGKKIITTNSSQFPTLSGPEIGGMPNLLEPKRLCLACNQSCKTAKHGLLGWTEKIKPKTQASCPASYVWLWSKTNNREGFTIINENICLWLMRHCVLCRYKQYFQPTVLSAMVYKPYFFSQRTVFFSHNKSANSTFSHDE